MRDFETVRAEVAAMLTADGKNGIAEHVMWCETWRELFLAAEEIGYIPLDSPMRKQADALRREIWAGAGSPLI